MDDILTQMIILMSVVVAGFISNKCGVMGEDLNRRLSNFIINVSCPCLILYSVMGDKFPDRGMIFPLLAVSTVTYVMLLTICYFLPRLFIKDPVKRGLYSFMLVFGNVTFMGYPVAAAIFGSEAVFYAGLLNMPNTLFVFAAGVTFVVGGEGKKRFDYRVLYCPSMVASYIAIIIVLAGIDNLPHVVTEPFRLLGNITVPGALLIIGSSMARIERRRMLGSVSLYIMAAFRLAIIPVSLYLLFRFIGVDETVNRINTIVIGMPVASFGTMFCLKYGRDETEMVRGTMITALLSVLSIPMLTLVFKVFG